MPTHYPDQQDSVPVERHESRCSYGVPDIGRCDLLHGHLGLHRIYGHDFLREPDFYQGAHSNTGGGWKWVLTKHPAVKPDCPTCGKS